MWVYDLSIQNIRCFESFHCSFMRNRREPYRWITLLSENGAGKSTFLQALGLLLAGPEGSQKLLPQATGWVRDESRLGRISTRVHQDSVDPGNHGEAKVRHAFGYSYLLTGSKRIRIGSKLYSEPTVVPSSNSILSWLRENAFTSTGRGWFAVGYGAFRRLTRSSQILVPSLEPQARFTNFSTQFDEGEPLSAFERWMVYLDYRIAKAGDKKARAQRELGVKAINRVLEGQARFSGVTQEGRILFEVSGCKVPTTALSDGFRSALALVGDLIWRLLQAFPFRSPFEMPGVVLIDELDIHLHPIWQRSMPAVLRQLFPRLQFFVATHSPLVASGAGEGALTLRLSASPKGSTIRTIEDVASYDVDTILQSPAFGLVSPFSIETQAKLDRYNDLLRKKKLTTKEKRELGQLRRFMSIAQPVGGPPAPGSLESKVDEYLKRKINGKGK